MALNDIFKVILKGGNLGQPTVNVFHFKQIGAAPAFSADDIRVDFYTTILANIRNVCAASQAFTEIDVYNITNPSDFEEYVLPSPLVGARPEPALPPFNTWSFKYERTIVGFRSGRKGIPGVSQGDQVDGSATGTIIPLLVTAANAMGATLTGGTGAYEPGVYSTVFAGSPRTPPVFMPVFNVTYHKIGSQNSRKFGH